jgi:hypothetical protein
MGGEELMRNIINEIKYDLGYLRSHTLQPTWFKILKVFILFGGVYGYFALFGLKAMIISLVIFLVLGLVLHLTYRIKTERYTRSWLDFVVIEENDELKTQRIGKYYYSAVIFILAISVIVSQVFR